MSTVNEAIAWLEVSKNSHSPSMSHVYATVVLGELSRLNEALDVCAREVELLERLRNEAVSAHRALESSVAGLEDQTRLGREEWDAARTDMEARLTETTEKLRITENMLKDVHHALTKQPELKPEEIANAITSVVTPYREGEKPVTPAGDPYLWESGT